MELTGEAILLVKSSLCRGNVSMHCGALGSSMSEAGPWWLIMASCQCSWKSLRHKETQLHGLQQSIGPKEMEGVQRMGHRVVVPISAVSLQRVCALYLSLSGCGVIPSYSVGLKEKADETLSSLTLCTLPLSLIPVLLNGWVHCK